MPLSPHSPPTDPPAGARRGALAARSSRVRATRDEIDRSPSRRPGPGCLRCEARARRRRRIRRRVFAPVAAFLVFQAAVVALLNWIDPPTTMFQLAADGPVVPQDTDIDYVSRYFLVLVMGQEDQLLPTRVDAFDLNDFIDRVQDWSKGKQDPSGSTIPQQLAKNLWLTPDATAWRKGAEAVLAEELAFLVSDARVLEIYINNAQLGPNVWGVCPASWYWFGHSPRAMSLDEAAQLVGLLPAPSHVRRGPNGGLDFTGIADRTTADTVTWARAHAEQWWHHDMNGLAATEALGITGTAGDRPADDDPCGHMPDSVAALIAQEGER
jgi:monofunctional biosynthetic peptidoglycan transglycosylase